MALDVVFAVILLGMVALGVGRGAVASAAGLFSLVAGYAGGILAASQLAATCAVRLAIPELLAPAVAGSLGFAVTWLIVSALGDVAVAWDSARTQDAGRSAVDRALGGLVGFVRGGFVVVLLAILASWLDAARDLGVVEGLDAIPDAQASSTVAASGDLVESVASSALAETGPAAQVVARIAARPGDTLASAQGLLEDPRLTQMFEDRLFWTMITSESVDAAMNRNAVRSIVEDAEMRGRFADLGLVAPESRGDPVAFRAELAGVLGQVAPKVARLQHDPALRRLAEDPEIVRLVEAGNVMALIQHPAFRQLVAQVSAR